MQFSRQLLLHPSLSDRKPRTFFCNRTILVHFFSSNDSYFFAVAASYTSSPSDISSRRAAALCVKLFAERYAMTDLCLEVKLNVSYDRFPADSPPQNGKVKLSQDSWRRTTYSSSACRAGNVRLMAAVCDQVCLWPLSGCANVKRILPEVTRGRLLMKSRALGWSLGCSSRSGQGRVGRVVGSWEEDYGGARWDGGEGCWRDKDAGETRISYPRGARRA